MSITEIITAAMQAAYMTATPTLCQVKVNTLAYREASTKGTMGDIEKAKREIRYAKSAADDRRWDLLDTRIQTIEAALDGVDDAERASVLAELAPLREGMTKALREEQASRIEREITRSLGNAADGSETSLEKAINRLAAADAQECLAPEVVQRFQGEIAAVQAKLGIAVATAPVVVLAEPQKPPASVLEPVSTPTTSAPAATLSDEARAIEGDVARTLRFAAEDVERSADNAESRIGRALAKLDSDEAKQHLPPDVMQHLRAQAGDLLAKIEAGRQAEKVAQIEEQIGRFTQQSENDLNSSPRSAANMLRQAVAKIDSEEAKRYLPAPTLERLRSEIARVQARIADTTKKNALERALPILNELEERTAERIFNDSQPAYRVLSDLDAEKSRVRGAISELHSDDADVQAIQTRLAAVDERIAEACASLDAEQARARVTEAWQIECEAVAGWEDEQHAGGTDTPEMPNSACAVCRLNRFLADTELVRIRAAHQTDAEVQSVFTEAERVRDTAAEKLDAAFDVILAGLENGPRPASRFGLEVPGRLAAQARSDLQGTQYAEPNVVRATALDQRWQAELEADRAAREAKYQALSAVADAAWPVIAAAIKAQDSFDPLDSQSRGKTVRLNGIRNRIGWDFSGAYDFAIWVNDTPVVGNYEKHVAAAVNDACERAGLPLDDHTDWDAAFVVGGPGKIKQRFRITVRDRNQMEIGTIEEWRAVDAVMCTVTALRAGPVAVGPNGR